MIRSGMKDNVSKKNTFLEIVLDDGEEVVECIEQAFKENNVKKAVLISASGFLREVKIATTTSGKMRQKEYSQKCRISSVYGQFYKKEEDYYGDVHISVAKDPIHKINGLLIKGIANDEVKIKFKVIKDDNLEVTKSKKQPMTMLKRKILSESKPKPKKPIMVA